MKKAYKITVSGKVQKRGYRNKVFQLANELDVNGYVKNLPTGEVEIVAEHESEAVLQQFIQRIKGVNGLVKVIDAKVEAVAPEGRADFEIIRGDKQDELLESMDYGAQYLADISGKQDQMLGKQDETLAELRGFKSETLTELRGLRGDFKEYIRIEFGELKQEIVHIKAELAVVKKKVMRN